MSTPTKVHSFRVEKELPTDALGFAYTFFGDDTTFVRSFHEVVCGDRKVRIPEWENNKRMIVFKPNLKLLGKVKFSVTMYETQKRSFVGTTFLLDQLIVNDSLGVDSKIRCLWKVVDSGEGNCRVTIDAKVNISGNWLMANDEAREKTVANVRQMQEAWLTHAEALLMDPVVCDGPPPQRPRVNTPMSLFFPVTEQSDFGDLLDLDVEPELPLLVFPSSDSDLVHVAAPSVTVQQETLTTSDLAPVIDDTPGADTSMTSTISITDITGSIPVETPAAALYGLPSVSSPTITATTPTGPPVSLLQLSPSLSPKVLSSALRNSPSFDTLLASPPAFELETEQHKAGRSLAEEAQTAKHLFTDLATIMFSDKPPVSPLAVPQASFLASPLGEYAGAGRTLSSPALLSSQQQHLDAADEKKKAATSPIPPALPPRLPKVKPQTTTLSSSKEPLSLPSRTVLLSLGVIVLGVLPWLVYSLFSTRSASQPSSAVDSVDGFAYDLVNLRGPNAMETLHRVKHDTLKHLTQTFQLLLQAQSYQAKELAKLREGLQGLCGSLQANQQEQRKQMQNTASV